MKARRGAGKAVEVSDAVDPKAAPSSPPLLSTARAEAAASEPGAHEVSTDGNLVVADGVLVRQSLSASGTVRVGCDARIEGALRAMRGASLEEGARVDGLLEVDGPLHWGRGASARSVEAKGPLMTGDQSVRAASVSASGGVFPRSRQATRRKEGSG